MKKLLGIVVLGLLWCNAGFAEIIDFHKCYISEGTFHFVQQDFKRSSSNDSWEDFNPKETFIDIIFTVDTNSQTITKTVLRKKGMNVSKLMKGKDKNNPTLKWVRKKYGNQKVLQETYQITTYSGGIVTAKQISKGQSSISETTVYLFLSGATVEYLSDTMNALGELVARENTTYRCDPLDTSSGGDNSKKSSGTAFFINKRGNLLTNHHVVDKCKQLKIKYFDKEYEAQLISSDKNLDLALLKVDLNPKSYLNFSSNMLKKRQQITIAGYPLGKGLSDDLKINDGKISSLKGFENNTNEVTVDIAINPGNSGGPIVDESGNLVAVAVSGMSKEVTEGINFGIKSWAVANFLSVNDIQPNMSNKYSKMNDDKLNQLLEESTLYISCTY